MKENDRLSALERINLELERLSDYEEMFFKLERESIIRCLLKGAPVSEADLAARAASCKLHMPNEAFCILGVGIDDMSSLYFEKMSRDSEVVRDATFIIQNVLSEMLGAESSQHWLATDCWNVCIICMDDSRSISQLKDISHSFTEFASAKFGLTTSVMISEICGGYSSIRDAYQHLLELRQFRQILGLGDTCMFYGEWIVDKNAYVPQNELEYTLSFLNSVVAENYEGALDAMDELIRRFYVQSAPPLEHVVSHFEGLKHVIFIAIEEIRTKYGADVDLLLRPENTLLTANVPTLKQNMTDVFRYLIDMRKNDSASPPSWLNEMTKFINANFNHVTMNITTISDHFGLNPSYVSRTFKKHIGISMLDYVNGLRVREAKRLISAGDSVSRTAELVGYGSTMSMRRAFKRYEGCTPSSVS